MKYVFLFAGDDVAWHGAPKEERDRVYQEIGRWFEENGRKGLIAGGEELAPARTATTVRNRQGKRVVIDGPYMEAKETIGGYAVVDAPDLDAAIALAKSWPGATVEIRPIIDHDH